MAAAFVVLLYVSVLIHELSHSLVARSYGLPVRRILLYPLGGFSEIEREPPTPGREFLVSAAGPALSLALAAAGLRPDARGPGGHHRPVRWSSQLAWANLVVGIFNLLPGLPLDGGRMLRAVIWKLTGRQSTATIAAAWAGRVLAVSLFVVPFVVKRGERDRRRPGLGAVAGGYRGLHVDRRRAGHQGDQVPRGGCPPCRPGGWPARRFR